MNFKQSDKGDVTMIKMESIHYDRPSEDFDWREYNHIGSHAVSESLVEAYTGIDTLNYLEDLGARQQVIKDETTTVLISESPNRLHKVVTTFTYL